MRVCVCVCVCVRVRAGLCFSGLKMTLMLVDWLKGLVRLRSRLHSQVGLVSGKRCRMRIAAMGARQTTWRDPQFTIHLVTPRLINVKLLSLIHI